MLNEIKEALEKIPKWPWTTDADSLGSEDGFSNAVLIAAAGKKVNVYADAREISGISPPAVRDFVAKSPEYISFLLSELEAKDKQVRELEGYKRDYETLSHDITEIYEPEIERLKKLAQVD